MTKPKKETPMPRIRGKAIEIAGKKGWSWWMEITIGDCEEAIKLENDEKKKVFSTKELAVADLEREAKVMIDIISKDIYKTEPTAYIDLIKNKITDRL